MDQSGVGSAIHWGFVGRRYLYNSQKNIPERYLGKSKNCLEDRYWPWFLWGIWSWLYSSYGFEELRAWTSIHINWSILNISILNTRNLILHIFGKSCPCFLCLRALRSLWPNTTTPQVFCLFLVKSLRDLGITDLLITLGKLVFLWFHGFFFNCKFFERCSWWNWRDFWIVWCHSSTCYMKGL